MVASLTTPFRARHPNVRFRIVSCTSIAVLGLLENLEVDAGLTYLENEPLGKVRSIPLYNEHYVLLTSPDSMFGDREQVTWKEVGQVPLCLLTPDMQNRRIIDRALKSAGVEATPTLTSNSIIVLYTHVKTGRWASVMPARLARTLGLSDAVPDDSHCRSHRDLQRRAGGSTARPPDAADRGTDANRTRSRADAGALERSAGVSSWIVQHGLRPVEGATALLQAEQRLRQFAHRLHGAFAIKRHQVGRKSDGDAVIAMVENPGRRRADHLKAGMKVPRCSGLRDVGIEVGHSYQRTIAKGVNGLSTLLVEIEQWTP